MLSDLGSNNNDDQTDMSPSRFGFSPSSTGFLHDKGNESHALLSMVNNDLISATGNLKKAA